MAHPAHSPLTRPSRAGPLGPLRVEGAVAGRVDTSAQTSRSAAPFLGPPGDDGSGAPRQPHTATLARARGAPGELEKRPIRSQRQVKTRAPPPFQWDPERVTGVGGGARTPADTRARETPLAVPPSLYLKVGRPPRYPPHVGPPRGGGGSAPGSTQPSSPGCHPRHRPPWSDHPRCSHAQLQLLS